MTIPDPTASVIGHNALPHPQPPHLRTLHTLSVPLTSHTPCCQPLRALTPAGLYRHTIVSRFGVCSPVRPTPPPARTRAYHLPTPSYPSLCEIESVPLPILPPPLAGPSINLPLPHPIYMAEFVDEFAILTHPPPPPSAHPLREGENLPFPIQILPFPRAKARPYRP